jgi:hypothetical protein
VSDHFFSRWSRRKQDAAKGLPLEEPAKPVAPTESAKAPPLVPLPASVEPAMTEPLPTLQQAQALSPSSDFVAFMKRGVPADVRNAAVKQLFADPHFNVMDGLDIYIGDYNTPDPLPAGMLQKMVSAQFMNLVPPEVSEPPQPSEALAQENPNSEPMPEKAPPLMAQSPHPQAETAWPDPHPSEHDDPDLQLQPNHAPASPCTGPGAG